MTTIRSFRPRERCLVNGYLVEVERHARRTSFVRVLDERLPGYVRVQLDKDTKACPHGNPEDAGGAAPTPHLGRGQLARIVLVLDDAVTAVPDRTEDA